MEDFLKPMKNLAKVWIFIGDHNHVIKNKSHEH